MSVVHWLHDGPKDSLPPKARTLCEAAAAGLPVPRGVVHSVGWSSALEDAARTLLRDGPVIARAALGGEDGPSRSAAGLGRSVGDLVDLAGVRDAVVSIDAARKDPWLVQYRGTAGTPEDRLVLQHQVPRDALVVAALLPDGLDYIEVHTSGFETLAHGDTPDFSGVAGRWDDARSGAFNELAAAIRGTLPMRENGLDVEAIVDPDGCAYLVQVRPLTRDLVAEGQAFVQAVHDAGQGTRLGGIQVLDAEHNPAPLSPAHASLIEWLARQRPSSGGLCPLLGWLYTRTRVRHLSGHHIDHVLTPAQALARLRDGDLPQARRRLAEVERTLRAADATGIRSARDAALSAFLAMIDVYLGVLLPVRAAAGRTVASTPSAPLSLRGRAAHADVLPAAWDLAAPTLGELARFEPDDAEVHLPTDPLEAAVLLTEWDDHLFALGLAPLRAVYRAAGRHLGLGDDAFGLPLEDLDAALAGEMADPGPIAAQNLARTRRWAALRPPAVLDEGRPLPLLPRHHLRGVPIGSAYEGPIAQRAGLEDLLRRPPDPACIVVLPSLTAQAALAIASLQLRAVCCEHGGALSHAALMLRELGLSGLIGCRGSTAVPDGQLARIDVTTGRLQIASSVTLGS